MTPMTVPAKYTPITPYKYTQRSPGFSTIRIALNDVNDWLNANNFGR